MRLFSLLLPVISLFSCTVQASDALTGSTHSITIHKWPLSAASPVPLGLVEYNPQTGEGTFKAEKTLGDVIADDEIVRVGIWDGKEGWSGCITAGSSLKDPTTAIVTLRIDEAWNIWHVEFSSNSSSSVPTVKILKSAPGPQPHLNKPVMLTAEGKIPVVEVEKSFLQKYWWVLLAGAVLMMSSGGGE